MDSFGQGFAFGILAATALGIVMFSPIVHSNGYSSAIADIKSYGAEKVVARFDKDHGK